MNNIPHSQSKFFIIKENKFYIKKTKKINKRELLSIRKQNCFKAYFLQGYKVLSAKILYNYPEKKEYLVEYFDGLTGENIFTGEQKTHKFLKLSF